MKLEPWMFALIVTIAGFLAAFVFLYFSKKSSSGVNVLQFFQKRPQLRGFLWGVFITSLVGILGQSIMTYQTPREQPQAAPQQQPPMQNDQELQTLQQKLTQNPNDTEALAALSHRFLRSMKIEEAMQANNRLLELDKNNQEGLVHQAVLKAAQGDSETALKDLDVLVKNNPTLAEAWFFKGMLAMQMGQQENMRQSFQKFVEVAPEGPQKERIKQMLSAQ